MNRKIKIPKKKDFTIEVLISLFCVVVFIFSLGELSKLTLAQQLILPIVIFPFVVAILYYRNRYRYYAPKFRTIKIGSLKEMCEFHQLMYVVNYDIIGFNLLLRGRNFHEEFFINLSVPEREVHFFEFCKQKEVFQKDYGQIIAISFLMAHPNGDELIPKRPAYKFWSVKNLSEGGMYFSKEVAEAVLAED